MKRNKFSEEILQILHDDHETVSALFEEICSTTERAAKKRMRLFETLNDELTRHAQAEEAAIYPRLQGVKESADKGFEAEEEHDIVKHLLGKLTRLEPTDERWLPTVQVLKEVVEHHVEEEETEIFKEIRKVFDKDELRMLPDAFRAAKGEEPPQFKRAANG